MVNYLLIELAPNSLTESIYEISGWNPSDIIVFFRIKKSNQYSKVVNKHTIWELWFIVFIFRIYEI